MKIKAQFTIGNDNLTFEAAEGADLKKELLSLINLKPRLFCDACSNKEATAFRLFGSEKDAFIYIKIICNKCGAQSNLGTYKNNKGYFWKKFEKYEKAAPAQTAQDVDADDIPFA